MGKAVTINKNVRVRNVPDWLNVILGGGTFIGLFFLEPRRPLHRSPPRLHGTYHSAVEVGTNSNRSSRPTIWNWPQETLRLGLPDQDVTAGLPGFRAPDQVVLMKLLEIPFGKHHHRQREGALS